MKKRVARHLRSFHLFKKMEKGLKRHKKRISNFFRWFFMPKYSQKLQISCSTFRWYEKFWIFCKQKKSKKQSASCRRRAGLSKQINIAEIYHSLAHKAWCQLIIPASFLPLPDPDESNTVGTIF